MTYRKYLYFFDAQENKKLSSNILSLFILQGVNNILPLITFPYLIRVLGVEYFGLLAFAGATVAYFGLITDYGFDLTATREISIYRDNKAKVIEIFSSIMTIKFILMFASFCLFTILVFSFEKFSQDALIYFLSFGTVIGQFLFPVWFFQGMEKMKYIAYLNILSKVIFTIAIFIFVQEKSNFYMVPILSVLGTSVSGIYALYFIKTNFEIKFVFQKTETMKYYLREAHHIFISKVAISLYTLSTTFILGILCNNTAVGYFAAADKVIQAFKGLTIPFSQAIYPYLSKKVNLSPVNGLVFIRKMTFFITITMGCISICIFVFADILIKVFLGGEYENSIVLVKIMSVLPFAIGLSNMFGIQTMLNFGRKKPFSQILIAGSLLSLILSFILVPLYQDIGSAFSVLIVESFITITMFVYLQNNGLKIIGENSRV